MIEKTASQKYTFQDATLNMQEIYALTKLGRQHTDETLHTIFNVTENDGTLDYLQKISDKLKECEKTGTRIYYAKADSELVGLVVMNPVRAVEGVCREYAIQVWAPDQTRHAAISREFCSLASEKCETVHDILLPKRVFDPMQNGVLLSRFQIPNEKRKEADCSFVEHLMKSMPHQIRAFTSGFSLKRMGISQVEAQNAFNLFEKNRYKANKYLTGFSEECETLEKTKNFLKEHSSPNSRYPMIFYAMCFNGKPVGMIWSRCSSECHLNLLVDENAGQSGFASEAVRLFEKELFKRGVSAVIIECLAENYAVPPIARNNKYTYFPEDESVVFDQYYKTHTAYACGAFARHSLVKQMVHNKSREK